MTIVKCFISQSCLVYTELQSSSGHLLQACDSDHPSTLLDGPQQRRDPNDRRHHSGLPFQHGRGPSALVGPSIGRPGRSIAPGSIRLRLVQGRNMPYVYMSPAHQSSNYFYNRRWQNYPRRFVPILRRNGATQTKTSFVTFVAQLKMEDHMFLVF